MMSKEKCLSLTQAGGEFGGALPEAILNCTAEIRRKAANPQFMEKFRLLLGLFVMFAGLYFGLFTSGAGEGLGFLAVLASPFVMVIDRT